MIRIEADAVYLPAACIEQSTSADAAGDAGGGGGGAGAATADGRCSCFPRRRRTRADAADAADDAAVARLPLDRLVGAELDDRGRVRVWFTAPEDGKDSARRKDLRGYVCPPPLQVRISAPVDAGGDTGGAEALIAALRASARQAPTSSRSPPPPPPRVVAIVNPVSGRGKAARDFEREARPVLERAAGLSVEVVPTRCAGHAREIARSLDLGGGHGGGGDGGSTSNDDDDDNDGEGKGRRRCSVVLVVAGGDGTLHEAVNGLLSRPDWRACARRVLLAQAPCGSGNGVAVSCGLRSAATAAVAVAKGSRAPLDVSSVLVRQAATPASSSSAAAAERGVLTRTFCVLSVVFGMMANLDVRTEPLRWMGEARFTLGGALEILGARTYACRGAWVGPAAAAAAEAGGGFLGEEDVGEEEGEDGEAGEEGGRPAAAAAALLAGGRARSCDLLAAAAPVIGGDEERKAAAAAACSVLDDGGPPLPLLAQLLLHGGKPPSRAGGGGLPERVPDALPPGWRPLPLRAPAGNGGRGEKGGGGGRGGGGSGGGAHMYAAVGPPYVAGNYRFNPLGALSSGALRQMWVPGHAVRGLGGRLASLALQDAAADGTHLDGGRGRGLMRHAPARALVFEPLAAPGETWVQLDGEVVRGAAPRAALFCELHKGLLRVAVRPGHPEEEEVF